LARRGKVRPDATPFSLGRPGARPFAGGVRRRPYWNRSSVLFGCGGRKIGMARGILDKMRTLVSIAICLGFDLFTVSAPSPSPELSSLVALDDYEDVVAVRQGNSVTQAGTLVQCPGCDTRSSTGSTGLEAAHSDSSAGSASNVASQPVEPSPNPSMAAAAPNPLRQVSESKSIDSSRETDSLGKIRERVVRYDKELPNFLCMELVRRYWEQNDPSITSPNWRMNDTVTVQLTYIEGHEDYKVVGVNNKPASAAFSMEGLGGSVTQGEFGTILKNIFELESQAQFEFGRRTKLQGHRALVLGYDIKQENSKYRLFAENGLEYVPAYRGQVFVDEGTNTVIRVTLTPYGIPRSFPVKSVTTTVDYDFVNIGNHAYVLPVRAEIISNHHSMWTRNIEQFTDYRKFGTDSKVKFDVPERLSKEK